MRTTGLLFGLPFGEDLYHSTPITGWHWFYLAIGLLFAGAGPMFPWIRTRTWVPEAVSASLSRASLDARVWIAALLLLFVYGTAPEIYRRATAPNIPPVVQGLTQQQVDEKIEAALKAERSKPSPIGIASPKLGPQKALSIAQAIGNPNFMPATVLPGQIEA
jgi:hypothetical protein